MGMDRFASSTSEDIFIRITGGVIDLHSTYDGLDANGNIFLEGGTLKISAPSMGMDGAIDCDLSLTVSGGELITAGSVLNASSNSTQATILVSYTQEQSSGSVIAIKDERGNTILEYTGKNSFSMSGFTSAQFKVGETYTLFVNGEKRTDITLSSIVTSIGDDGGTYNAGRGMGRGDWGNMPSMGGNRPGGGAGGTARP